MMPQRLFTRFNRRQQVRRWAQMYKPAAWHTTVGIMGMGVLGQDAVKHLRVFGYPLRRWSRAGASSVSGMRKKYRR